MKYIITIFLSFFLFASLLFSQDQNQETKNFLYFRSGKILSAEIQEKAPDIINISKWEPPSTITKNIGWAVVVVKLDRKRTIGIYDYILKNKNGTTFPCVAIREKTGPFDAGNWQIEKTTPNKLYSMLFKVEKPKGKPQFDLVFNLPVDSTKAIPLEFQIVDEYTSPDKIPQTGIYGIEIKRAKKPEKTTAGTNQSKTNSKNNNTSSNQTAKPTGNKNNKTSNSDSNKVDFLKGKKGAYYKVSSQNKPNNSIDKALDGNLKTEWHTQYKNQKHWIRLKVPGGKKAISKLVIKWGNEYPKSFKVVTKTEDKKPVKFSSDYKTTNNKGGTTTININKTVEVIKIQDMEKPSSKKKNPLIKIKEIEVFSGK